MRSRLLLSLLLLLALVAAACSDDSSDDGTAEIDDAGTSDGSDADSGDDDSADDGDTDVDGGDADGDTDGGGDTDGDVELTASAPGVTEDTIRIGLAIAGVSAFSNAGDVVSRYRAAADEVNENGGIIGRQIEFVVEEWDSLDSAGLDAACIALTEDVEVFLVLLRLPAALGDPSCFSDLGETITVNALALEANAVATSDGRLFSTNADAFTSLLGGLPAIADDLAGAKVALNGASEPGEEERMQTIADALDDLDIEVVATTLATVAYADDATASLSEQDTFTQIWVNEGATHVIGINAGAIGAAEAIENNALADDLTLITGVIGLRSLGALGTDLTPLSMIGVAAPVRFDVGAAGLNGTPECLRNLTDRTGEVPNTDLDDGEVNNIPSALEGCDAMDFLAAAFEQAGPNPTQESFLAAIESGFDFEMTSAASARADASSAYLNRDAGEIYDWNGTEFVARG